MRTFHLFIFSILLSFPSYGLNIDQTIKSTVENNPKVKIGIEKLVESKELIINASASKLPTVTGTLSGTYANSEKDSKTGTTTPETFTDKYKLTVTQNLFDSGFNDLEIERSKILYENEIINFNITLQNLILDAITGYLTVINYEKSLDATIKNYESVSKAFEEIKIRFNSGSSTLYELQNSESAFAIAEANLFAAQKNLEISKKSFESIVSLEPTNLIDEIDIDNSINFMSSIELAKTNNLNVKLLNNNKKNYEILILKEQKSKKPSLDFSGSAEYSDDGRIDDGTQTTNSTVGITLTIPIFQKGIDNSNIRKYHSLVLQSELNYQDYINDLNIEMANIYKDFNISRAKMKSNLLVITASETAIKSLKEEYLIGTKTINDIVEEETNLLLAYVNYFDSRKEYLVNYFRIKLLEGTLLKDFDKYLPKIN